jgi:uncharacterized membrane protein (DUF485 family)
VFSWIYFFGLHNFQHQGIQPLPETPTIEDLQNELERFQNLHRERRKLYVLLNSMQIKWIISYIVWIFFWNDRFLKQSPETRGVVMTNHPHIVIFEIVKRYLGDRSLLQPETYELCVNQKKYLRRMISD